MKTYRVLINKSSNSLFSIVLHDSSEGVNGSTTFFNPSFYRAEIDDKVGLLSRLKNEGVITTQEEEDDFNNKILTS